MRFAHVLADDWVLADRVAPGKAKAFDTPLRNSEAGDCSLALVYTLRGHEPEAFDEAGIWVTGIGTLIHEKWQESLTRRFPAAKVEIEPVVGNEITSGHLDALITEDNWMIALELKTVNGTGFRRAVGAPSGWTRKGASAPEPKGPRKGDVCQLALNAHMAGADEARLCYVAMEAVSKGKEELGFDGFDRFCAEWQWYAPEFTPIAKAELARFAAAIAAAKRPGTPAAEYEGKLVSPPGSQAWPCLYCSHQLRCLKDHES